MSQSKKIALLFCSFLYFGLKAQFSVNTGLTADSLARILSGTGVQITNPTLNCSTTGSGRFDNAPVNLGFSSGVILTNGNANDAISPSGASSPTTGSTTDPTLSAIATGATNDDCVLDFDIKVLGDTLEFNYVFSSEEYLQFECAGVNDLFGFFISGPNPAGGTYVDQNIALIPGTANAVSIDNVNSISTCNGNNGLYYNGGITGIEYNGNTVTLIATIPTSPCQTYSLKLAIADVGDQIIDSGVFLQESSFTSNVAAISAASAESVSLNYAVENCANGVFNFELPVALPFAQTIFLDIAGTATEGVDYNFLPDSIYFPIGSTLQTLSIIPTNDALIEGTETIKIRTLAPCDNLPYDSAELLIFDDVPFTLTPIADTICLGQTVQVNSSGAASYSWWPSGGISSTTSATPIIFPSAIDTHFVAHTLGTCTDTASVYVKVGLVNVTFDKTDVSCGGTNNGSATAIGVSNVTDSADLTYQWNTMPVSNTASINNLAAGSYTVTVTDQIGCTKNGTVNIVVPPSLVVDFDIDSILCNGDSANVTLNQLTGNTIYDINYTIGGITTGPNPFTSNASGEITLTNLAIGSYLIGVVESGGSCSDSITVNITEPSSLVLVADTQNILCNGDSSGTASVSVSGGVSPYTFLWNNASTNDSIQNLGPGNYSVEVTDANGCIDSAFYTITEDSAINISIVNVKPVKCFGQSNGEIQVDISGGAIPYTFLWSNGATTEDLINVPEGNYCLTVTDNNGCIDSVCAIITQADSLQFSLSTDSSSCGASSGMAFITNIQGGILPYSILWEDASTNDTLFNLDPGVYSVTVSDDSLCTVTDSIEVFGPPQLVLNKDSINVDCFGYNTGQAEVIFVNGTLPLNYNWSNSTTLDSAINLSAGIISVIVTDNELCTDTLEFNIQEPDILEVIQLDSSNVLCNGDSSGFVFAVPQGGIAPYTYAWNDYANQTNDTAFNLPIGIYTVVITDSNSCTTSDSVEVLEPTVLEITQIDSIDVDCNGSNTGSVFASANGGTAPYTFVWNDAGSTANDTVNNLPAGTYTVTVTDVNGCEIIDSVEVTEPSLVEVFVIDSVDVSCFGLSDGLAFAEGQGGTAPYTYLWNDAATTSNDTAFNLPAGIYTVTITDSNNCVVQDSVEVNQPVLLEVTTIDSINVICFGESNGQAFVEAQGGTLPYTYLWNDLAATTNDTVSNLPIGTYTVIITDANNCIITDSVIVNQPDVLEVLQIDSSNVLCNGDSSGFVFAVPQGGIAPYTYAWNDYANQTNDTAFNLPIGIYTVVITDSNSCTTTDSVVVLEPTALEITQIDSIDVDCNGSNTGSVFASANGGTAPYTFVWNDAGSTVNDTVNNLPAGTYTVTVTDANGCEIIDSVEVTEPSLVEVFVIDSVDVSCFGLSDGFAFAEGQGGTAPYTYLWNDAAATANDTAFNLPAGIYTVTITDSNNCVVQDSVEVNQPVLLEVTTIDSINVICFGESNGQALVEAQGGTLPYTYLWNDLAATTNDTVSNLPAGTYTVIITDANNCTTSDSVIVNQPDSFYVNNIGFDSVSCYGLNDGSVFSSVQGGVSPYAIVWNDALNTINDTVNNLGQGTYTVTYTDANNCIAIDSIVLQEPDSLDFTIANLTDVACFGDSTGSIVTNVLGGNVPYTYLWSDGTTNPDLTNLAIGNYSAIVEDSKGCQDSIFATITQNTLIEIAFGFDTTSCSYDDGRAYLDSITGGVEPYTYNWINPFSTADTIDNLETGFYPFQVTDSLNCTVIDSAEVLPPALFTKDSMNVSCFNGNDAWAKVTPIFGTPPFTFTWSNGAVGVDSIGSLSIGIYEVIVTNSEGCADSTTFNITQPDSLQVNLVQDSVSCFGFSDGSIVATPIDGTAPYSYLWNDAAAQTTDTAFNLSAGLYSVNVSDANTCIVIDSIPVLQPDSAYVIIDSVLNVACNGDSTGSIFISAIGGTQPFTYLWNNGNTNQDLENVLVGNYNVVATDANNCTYNADTAIIEPGSLTITMNADSVLCNADSTGIAYLTIGGGTVPYTYQWNDYLNQTNDTAFSLPTGEYVVIANDANGCSVTDSIIVFEPNALQIYFVKRDVLCFGDSTGWSKANVSGGTAPFSYQWNDFNAQTLDSAFNLPIGWYTVTVTDANLCSITDSILIEEPTALSLNVVADSVSCNGLNDGSAWAIALGGTDSLGLYSYLWSDGQTSDTASNLIAGTYIVTVTDSLACTITDSVEVFEPTPLVIVIDSTINVDCNGNPSGSIFTSTTGGTLGYTYVWDNTVSTTEDVNALSANTYEVIVTDANACMDTANTSITEPTALVISSGTDSVLCNAGNDGLAFTNVSGGTLPYTYIWNDPATTTNDTASNLTPGSYIVNVTDSQNCMISDTVEVFEPQAIVMAFDITNVSCFNGNDGFAVVEVTSGGTGPFTFTWSNAQVNDTATMLSNGEYWVTASDANGCTKTDTINITHPSGMAIDTMYQDSVSCFGLNTGSAIVVASGGTTPYSYQWNDALVQTNDTAFNLLAGMVTVLVTDSNGCTASDSIQVLEPTPLVIVIDSTINVDCNGNPSGSIFTSTTGGTLGYTYVWDNTVSTTEDVNALSANTYEVIVTDANACMDTANTTITEPASLAISSGTDSVLCNAGNDGLAFTNVSGGTLPYTYIWNDPANTANDTASNLTPGSYIVNVTDSQNCMISDTVEVFEPQAIVMAFNITNVSCFNGIDGTATVSVTSGGTGPYTFVWEDMQMGATATNLSVGNILVTVTDANGCTDTASANIAQPIALLTSNVSSITNVLCNGESNGTATLAPTGGTTPYNYTWNNTQTTNVLTSVAAGTYFVVVGDASGCSVNDTVIITEPTALVIDSLYADSVKCFGESNGEIYLSASGGTANYQYAIDGGSFGSVQNFTDLVAGNYDLTVKDNNGCEVNSSIIVYEPAPMIISITPADTTINLTNQVSLNLNIEAPYTFADVVNIEWTPNENIDCAFCETAIVSPLNTTEYEVMISYTQNYCEVEASAIVNVENNLTDFIPSGFSPNGDGVNDVLNVMGLGFKDINMKIFNRWGELIFESDSQDIGWDGTFKNQGQPIGVYVYFFTGTLIDGKEIKKEGSITLLR